VRKGLSFRKEEDWKLLQDFGEGKYDRKVVNAVKTRVMKAAELEEAKRDEESMREEQAGT